MRGGSGCLAVGGYPDQTLFLAGYPRQVGGEGSRGRGSISGDKNANFLDTVQLLLPESEEVEAEGVHFTYFRQLHAITHVIETIQSPEATVTFLLGLLHDPMLADIAEAKSKSKSKSKKGHGGQELVHKAVCRYLPLIATSDTVGNPKMELLPALVREACGYPATVVPALSYQRAEYASVAMRILALYPELQKRQSQSQPRSLAMADRQSNT